MSGAIFERSIFVNNSAPAENLFFSLRRFGEFTNIVQKLRCRLSRILIKMAIAKARNASRFG
jgi:hypothetical protein